MPDYDRGFFATIRERYDAETSPPPGGLDVSTAYGYVRYKAFMFLTVGVETYRQVDAFGQPSASWPDLVMEKVMEGCRQLLDWRGITPDQPLDGIGIGPFYKLVRMFHFEVSGQSALVTESDQDHFYDRMEMHHVITGDELVLFNRVLKPGRHAQADAPCPYCGAPLRTPAARQCRSCRTDWHDPANVKRLQ